MTRLRKDSPGGAAGFSWDEAGAVVDVPRDLAAELLAIPDADFTEVADEPEGDAPLPTKKADLVALADSLGIDASGTVKDLTERITAHNAEPEPEVEPEVAETDVETEVAAEPEGDEVKTPITEPDPDAQA